MVQIRYLIVLFFLVIVPVAAAADAVAPDWIDNWMGRIAPKHLGQTFDRGEGPLRLKRPASASKLPKSAPPSTQAALPTSTSQDKAAIPPAALPAAPFSSTASSAPTPHELSGLSGSPRPQSPGASASAAPAAPISTGVAPSAPVGLAAARRDPPAAHGGEIAATGYEATAGFGTSSPVASSNQVDRVAALQGQLARLGASYANLEIWPGPSPKYRFYCRVPAPDNPAYHKPFEAVASDPVAAARAVLDEVETWLASAARPSGVLASPRVGVAAPAERR